MGLRYFDYYNQLEKKLRIEKPLMAQAGRWIARQISLGGNYRYFASRSLSGVALNFGNSCQNRSQEH